MFCCPLSGVAQLEVREVFNTLAVHNFKSHFLNEISHRHLVAVPWIPFAVSRFDMLERKFSFCTPQILPLHFKIQDAFLAKRNFLFSFIGGQMEQTRPPYFRNSRGGNYMQKVLIVNSVLLNSISAFTAENANICEAENDCKPSLCVFHKAATNQRWLLYINCIIVAHFKTFLKMYPAVTGYFFFIA